jgi:hypothetical protein
MSQKCAHTSFTFYSHVTFTYVHTYIHVLYTVQVHYCSVDIQELLHIFKKIFFILIKLVFQQTYTPCVTCTLSMCTLPVLPLFCNVRWVCTHTCATCKIIGSLSL